MKNKFVFNSLVNQIFQAIDNQGGRVFLVGGIVRDMKIYNHVDYHDVDVEVYGLEKDELEQLLKQFDRVNLVGKSFGIFKLAELPNYDFAMPRIEHKIGNGHQDFEIEVDKNLDLKTAASRRDFTINALMYEVKTGKIYDFYHGLDDLKKRTLRMVNQDTFKEDPLRVLRAAQFASRFDFYIEPQTKLMCKQMVKVHSLENLSVERIYEEYNKLLLSNHPSMGLKFLKEINALWPCLEILSKTMQRLDFHPEGDVWTHTLLVTDLAALCKDKTSNPLAFMWSALLHDIGKPEVTTPEGRAPGHNESGVRIFEQQVAKYLPDKKIRRYVKTMIFYHMHLMNMVRNGARDYGYFRILKGINGIVPVDDLILLTKCDKLGRYKDEHENINRFDYVMKEKMARLGKEALPPVINGNDLKELQIEQSAKYKEILDWAYDQQLRGHDRKAILKMLKGR